MARRSARTNLERHGVRASGVDLDVPRGDVPVEHFGHAVV